ncbi:hypothetical protein N431DRAFT_514414 [Stipitochalara longipes BDJ]|nr:hypothetical protein N431DRAFT_514414 [Stipitochalara longipes BDJ]
MDDRSNAPSTVPDAMPTSAGSEWKSDEGSLTALTSLSVPGSRIVGILDAPAASSELLGLDAPLIPGSPAMVPDRDNSSKSPLDNPARLNFPPPVPDTQSAAQNALESKASKLLAAEEETWREIHEDSGGSIQRYHEMTIEKMNTGRSGVIFPPQAAILEEGELIGDKKSGYENMVFKDKLLAWWTKKQWKIWSGQVLKEINDAHTTAVAGATTLANETTNNV